MTDPCILVTDPCILMMLAMMMMMLAMAWCVERQDLSSWEHQSQSLLQSVDHLGSLEKVLPQVKCWSVSSSEVSSWTRDLSLTGILLVATPSLGYPNDQQTEEETDSGVPSYSGPASQHTKPWPASSSSWPASSGYT